MSDTNAPTLIAGVPSDNMTLFHRIRFDAHDPAALIIKPDGTRLLILRDVELDVAKRDARADEIHAYEDFEPEGGLSADRPTRAAQAAAECLRRLGADHVIADGSLGLLFVDQLDRAGIGVELDPSLGIADRRAKTEEEVRALRDAQRVTEAAVRMACELIATAKVNGDGALTDPSRAGGLLTSERVKALIISHLAENGALTAGPIVAGGPVGASCHNSGTGVLRTGEPVIIDVFPKHLLTGYCGDCTRVVIHGKVPGEVARMHDTVLKAKRAGIAATRADATGEDVHRAVVEVIEAAGYAMGFPKGHIPMEGPPTGECTMPHGTGHGIGLELKEPPLLDFGGPQLVVGDAVTVEPGLYAPGLGGIRIEDLVIVTEDGCENLNELPEGLEWA